MIECPACRSLHQAADGEICPQCGFAPAEIDGFPSWAGDPAGWNAAFNPGCFSQLAALEADNFWFRARNALIIWAIRKYFPHFSSFLEVGCGTGYVLSGISRSFPSVKVCGGDLFTAGLAFARARLPGVSLMQMDARHLPFVEEFDVGAVFDVIEHFEEDSGALRSLHRALKPRGGLLVTVPQHEWLWSSADEAAQHVRRYTAAELHAKIRAAGFEILRSTSFVSLLLPVMWASRRRARKGGGFDPLDEFRISTSANAILATVLSLERVLIRAGLDFPVGGSRLVVTRRSI